MGTHPIFESDFDCLTDMGQTEKRKKIEKSDQVAAKKTKWTKKPGKDQDGEKKPFKKDFKSKKQNFNKNKGKAEKAEGENEGENQKEKKEKKKEKKGGKKKKKKKKKK